MSLTKTEVRLQEHYFFVQLKSFKGSLEEYNTVTALKLI